MTSTQQLCSCLGCVVLVVAVSGCGSSPSSPSNPSSASGPIAATITITAAGVSTNSVTVAAGSRVQFVNNDTRSHNMTSDPHPVHTDCPEINQAGLLNAGQSRATGNLTTVRVCGFHDHDNPDNAALRGTIRIQ